MAILPALCKEMLKKGRAIRDRVIPSLMLTGAKMKMSFPPPSSKAEKLMAKNCPSELSLGTTVSRTGVVWWKHTLVLLILLLKLRY